ncbi:MAG: class II glutamine amidotransferase [Candidatus Aramenus sp.]|nr:class II glutamine amidotransferase [Candidatus Aramenus sp.]
MCRMFAYVGESVEDMKLLYSLLVESARKDVIAERLGLNPVHGDGWGLAIYDGERLLHYRSSKPIFEEELPDIEVKGKFYAIFHARQATNKATVSARFSHPFLETNETQLVFLAHNGWVDEERLKEKLNFRPSITTDSELALKYYTKIGDVKFLEEVTKSALNLLILKVSRESGEAELLYENYYVRKDRPEYYDMYLWEGKGGIAVMSSTLKYYGNLKVRDVEKGKLLKLG